MGVCSAKNRQKSGEIDIKFSLGAEVFANLKQGSIQDYYDIGKELGEGGYGKVFHVVHIKTKLERALKRIKKTSVIKNTENQLFEEMNILKCLDHPNIVRVFELYQDEYFYYLVTDYCSGGELFDKIKSLNQFSERMAADYFKQILSAVLYCHEHNIAHRDLKPENLLLDSKKPNSNIKLIDFGTSRKFLANEKMSTKYGTPYYIAPEVLKGDYNEKCDIWSCGIILYIMLCGYPPFNGDTEEEIISSVLEGKLSFDR